MSLRLPLEKKPKQAFQFNDCLPFLENSRAVLIHRPRFIAMYHLGEIFGRKYPPHLGITMYCRNSVTGGKNLTFLNTLNDEMILCVKCEENAVKAGLPSAESICCKHVHIGGVKSYKLCCKD